MKVAAGAHENVSYDGASGYTADESVKTRSPLPGAKLWALLRATL